ncbi:MAG TPA: anti-sigma factor antagonist [Flavobacteriales bacterium]|nr:anti-sigma factor antagonist [Flavobacteriales bacterium]
MEFNYTLDKKKKHTVVKLIGNLIAENQTTELLNDIDEHIVDSFIYFVVDLSELDHMNSNGLNILINILTKSRNAGGETVITGLSEKISKLIVITKLNTVFAIADNQEEAVGMFNKEESWL